MKKPIVVLGIACATLFYTSCSKDDAPTPIEEKFTIIKDANFEKALIALKIDDLQDGKVKTAEIVGLSSLDISNKEIKDLTGIADFKALTSLNAKENKLTSYDLSANLLLSDLNLENCDIASIDLSKNTALINLSLNSNAITSIDLSNNINLVEFLAQGNGFTALDVSKNTKLINLEINSNPISTLDVTKLTNLRRLYAGNCGLSSIDLSANTLLEGLMLSDNDFTRIDLSNNKAISGFCRLEGNPKLRCITVATELLPQITAANGVYAQWQKDATAFYTESCNILQTLTL